MTSRLTAHLALSTCLSLLGACGDTGPTGPEPITEVVGLEYGGGTFTQTLDFEGGARSYTVVVPESAAPTEAAPVLLVFHDTGQGVEAMRTLSGFDRIAELRGWIVAYLASAEGSWGLSDRVSPGSQGLDDVSFAVEVVRRVSEDLVVDPGAVFAAGFGEGGLMAQALGCFRSDLVAAVAAVGTSASIEVASDCDFVQGVSGLIIAGTEDPVHPFSGGRPEGTYGLFTAPGAALWWAGALGCTGIVEITSLPDVADDGTRIERTRYPICVGSSEVRLYVVVGGGHAWPGSAVDLPGELGTKSRDLDATDTLAEFFEQHRRP